MCLPICIFIFESTYQIPVKFGIVFALKSIEGIQIWFISVQYNTYFIRRSDRIYIVTCML
jgi:hypothetical protein